MASKPQPDSTPDSSFNPSPKAKSITGSKKDPRIKGLGVAHLGIQFAVVVLAMILGGRYLDTRWNSAPLMTLLGLFVGFFAGLYHLLKGLGALPDRIGRPREPDDARPRAATKE